MSQDILNNFSHIKSYKYDSNINTFVAIRHHIDIDVQEMLDITFVLENNFIPYKICSGFNIRILKKGTK